MQSTNLYNYITNGHRPSIRGRQLPVATIVQHARNVQWSVPVIAANFELTTAQVLAAFLYYEENRHLFR